MAEKLDPKEAVMPEEIATSERFPAPFLFVA